MSKCIRFMPAICLLAMATDAAAQAPADDPAAFVAAVTAHWRQRRASIKTVTCVVEVDQFFPMGSLSPLDPPEDASFTGEPLSYTFDLADGRCRKFSKVTNPWEDNDRFTLKPEELTHIYDGRNYRLFRVVDPANKKNNVIDPDVVLYEDGVHTFFFLLGDMPIFWTFGSLTNHHPMPARLLNEIPFDRFKVGDEVELQGRKCRALTTQEQNSPTSIREFLIDVEPPYLIRQCSARSGKNITWKMDVAYRDNREESLSHWTLTDYNNNRTSKDVRTTYRVKKLDFNYPVDAKLFDASLRPDQVVFSAPDNQPYVVAEDQSLLPYTGEPLPSGRWWWRIGLGTGLLTAAIIPFAVRWQRRRAQQMNR